MMHFNASMGARMSPKEKCVVRYIVQRLYQLRQDGRGRGVYDRNVDQIFRDIFGVKGFCKTLDKGMRNENTMVQLIQSLDLTTIWNIVRSPDHFRMLSILVALDVEIVKDNKRCERCLAVDPAIRDGDKYRKASKALKANLRSYKATVKTFRELFDIRRPIGTAGQLGELAEDWRDRHERQSSFWDDDYPDNVSTLDTIESMDAFVASKRRGANANASSGTGAFNIFGTHDSDTGPRSFFEDDYSMSSVLDDDEAEYERKTDRMVDAITKIIDEKIDDRMGATTSNLTPVSYDSERDALARILERNTHIIESLHRPTGGVENATEILAQAGWDMDEPAEGDVLTTEVGSPDRPVADANV